MEAHAHDDHSLARVRAEFDLWRATRSGRGRIPDRLWRLAVSLLDLCSPTAICKELRVSARDLHKHRLALADPSARPQAVTPTFLELRAVDLPRTASRRTPVAPSPAYPSRVVLERVDGARLTLDVSEGSLDTLITAFLRG
jgi:hypothetical protein